MGHPLLSKFCLQLHKRGPCHLAGLQFSGALINLRLKSLYCRERIICHSPCQKHICCSLQHRDSDASAGIIKHCLLHLLPASAAHLIIDSLHTSKEKPAALNLQIAAISVGMCQTRLYAWKEGSIRLSSVVFRDERLAALCLKNRRCVLRALQALLQCDMNDIETLSLCLYPLRRSSSLQGECATTGKEENRKGQKPLQNN